MRKGDGIFMAYEIGGKSQLKLHISCATLDTYSNMLFVTKNVGPSKSQWIGLVAKASIFIGRGDSLRKSPESLEFRLGTTLFT